MQKQTKEKQKLNACGESSVSRSAQQGLFEMSFRLLGLLVNRLDNPAVVNSCIVQTVSNVIT